jgi:hypothetical protein
MNTKKLQLQPRESLDDFRIRLLRILKIHDDKKDCLIDFENRIDNYFNRNKELKIEIEIDIPKLFKTIYDQKFWSLKRYKQEIPENYPMGGSNMETQAYYNPIVCDEKYYEDAEKTKIETQLEVDAILIELEILNKRENIEIKLKE